MGSADGIMGLTQQMISLLQLKDEELHAHLEQMQIPPACYAVRWLVLMFTQDLDMPDVLRAWDALLSDVDDSAPLLLYMCVARLILAGDIILNGNFDVCCTVLQGPPDSLDIRGILALGQRLRAQDVATACNSHR